MLSRLRFEYTRLSSLLAERLRNNFYLYLALLLSLGVLADASLFHVGANMKQKAFDFVVRHRITTPQPDADIVIVDINEASLAALAPEYGRWPWPRQVFGEFLEKLEAQQPKAVVFDILFSDADLQNPDSDAYFNAAVEASSNTFFPFLRLPQEHDHLSQVKPGMIPGVRAVEGQASSQDATVAVVLPHFEAALKAGRLGTHNIEPDPDGIVREYRMWRDLAGWRLPSLPLVIAQSQSWPAPQNDSLLLNWRGEPFTYRYQSFSDVYQDMTAKNPKRPRDEFHNKIVIIGSTAPSLFDIKATAMAKTHPGVEILATAIDNIKHNDDLKIWHGATPYILLSLMMVWLTAAAFYRNIERDRFDRLFGMSQLVLLGVSYLSINLANVYIDLTAPVTWAVGYFSIAKIYALATDRVLQRLLATEIPASSEAAHASLLLIEFNSPQPLGEAVLKNLRRGLETASRMPCFMSEIRGTQSGLWGLFSDTLAVTWMGDPGQAGEDATNILAHLPGLMKRLSVPGAVTYRHILHHGILRSGENIASQWRLLFAQTLIKMESHS